MTIQFLKRMHITWDGKKLRLVGLTLNDFITVTAAYFMQVYNISLQLADCEEDQGKKGVKRQKSCCFVAPKLLRVRSPKIDA
jgi:hypothetical protein